MNKAGVIELYESISLEEMGRVKLMNRVDTKYVASAGLIWELLDRASSGYFVQEIEGRRIMPYHTVYLDTEDDRMYYDHERGKKDRRKVRIRTYEGTGDLRFLEIKDKNNKGRTKKKRVELEPGEGPENHGEFIKDHSEFLVEELSPKIENRFNRITLANPDWTERITIDLDIEFHNITTGRGLFLPSIGIIEWKRDALAARSVIAGLLHSLHIHPSGFSKYVIGMALTDPSLRKNRIKPRLRLIEKIATTGQAT